MSRSLNKVMLIGNVGKDPVLQFTPGGIPVTYLKLATSETWRDNNNRLREQTDWHTVVAWRGLAEVVCKLLKKGDRVYIEGKIQTRTFHDRGGKKKHVVEVVADQMLTLENKGRHNDSLNYSSDNEDDEAPPRDDDEIPF
ncbi:MAG: single-stranded DNA-binding protein [Candidatus Kapaibacterium sp.]